MDFSREAFREWGRQGGRKGGRKGGRRRMANLTREQRRRLARKAVLTRWRRKRTASVEGQVADDRGKPTVI